MMKLVLAGALALAFSLAGCSTLPNGDTAILGQDIGVKASATVTLAASDIAAFVAALPSACAIVQEGAAFTQAEVIVAQSVMKVPPKTAADLDNAATKISTACAGTAAAAAIGN